MTLVVARVHKDCVAIAADTMISMHGTPLSMQQWALKSICLPGGICVSYSGSPELATKAFSDFRKEYPQGANYGITVRFFEKSSKETNNDYIIAFADTARLVTVRDGRRKNSLSDTHWIGDKDAYERFRSHHFDRGRSHMQGRAVTAVIFADEMDGSPASDLYTNLSKVVADRDVPSVGGFVTVLSNRDIGFRFSVYSDILFDWPAELNESDRFDINRKFDLRGTGENDRYSLSQISPGYYNVNTVAFYILKGRLLIIFYEAEGAGTVCLPINNVEPEQIASTLDEKMGFQFRALCLVMSSRDDVQGRGSIPERESGASFSLYCEANTMPKPLDFRTPDGRPMKIRR